MGELIVNQEDTLRYKQVYDEYIAKFNKLAGIIEDSGIELDVLNDVLELKSELIKLKIIIKIDNFLKI